MTEPIKYLYQWYLDRRQITLNDVINPPIVIKYLCRTGLRYYNQETRELYDKLIIL